MRHQKLIAIARSTAVTCLQSGNISIIDYKHQNIYMSVMKYIFILYVTFTVKSNNMKTLCPKNV